MKNPYSLVFGVEPSEYISRISQTNRVIDDFLEDNQRLFMVTGVRGSGKTVFMTEIKNQFKEKKDWEVIELSTERNMLNGLVSKLSSKDKLTDMFRSAKINLSVLGFGFEISGTTPIADMEVALQKMLETMNKHNKKLLVVVDEAIDNKNVREFASVFQIMIREGLPIYLLMTGLYENIDDLQNEKNLTFLHRAPKVNLVPLNMGTMADSYRRILKVDEDTSIEMAQLTKGYPYAFQVLGYCTWEKGVHYTEVITEFKQYLEEYVYDKIWSELSEKDKKIVYGISQVHSGKIKDIREKLGLSSNEFTPYKRRLVRKGVIGDDSGYARFALPLFDKFVKENYIK